MYRTGCCRSHHLTALLVPRAVEEAVLPVLLCPCKGRVGQEVRRSRPHAQPCRARVVGPRCCSSLVKPNGVCQALPLLFQSETAATLSRCSLLSPMSKAAPSRTINHHPTKPALSKGTDSCQGKAWRLQNPNSTLRSTSFSKQPKPHRSLSLFQEADAFNTQLHCRNIKLTC